MIQFGEEQLLEIIRLSKQDNLSSRQIAEVFGCGKSTINDFLSGTTHKTFWEDQDEKPVVDGVIENPDAFRKKLTGKRYVFTCAQNNTYVHDSFFKSLLNYCEENDAELIVGTIHYNRNAYQKRDDQDNTCWFDPKITQYIRDEDLKITDDLIWCGAVDISPTAVNPLVGFHSYTTGSSGIFAHTKLQMESVPTAKFSNTKLMYTTGTVTQRNYVQRKTGQIASFHHTYSALVAEIDDDGDWFVRQLTAETDTGSFYDFDKRYSKDGVEKIEGAVEAVNWGDIHSAKEDPEVTAASWGDNDTSILNVLKPSYQFVHDVFDMQYRNHHNFNDPYFRYKMFVNGTESVEEELIMTATNIESMDRYFCQIVVVQSNHDLALKRWLKEQDYKEDPVNALFFLELQLASYQAIKDGDKDFAVFEYASKLVNKNIDHVIFLSEDESFIICGNIETGQHGHNGNNGARGSTRAFQIQGVKINVGHAHSAGIKDGVWTSGVSGRLNMGYNIGGSSWSNSHILSYENGKRAMVTIKNGKWKV